MFLIRPVDTLIAMAETEYVINDLKAKKIGLECVDNATGVNGCNAAKKVIAPEEGRVGLRRAHELDHRHRPHRAGPGDERSRRDPRLQLPEPARR